MDLLIGVSGQDEGRRRRYRYDDQDRRYASGFATGQGVGDVFLLFLKYGGGHFFTFRL